MMKITCAATQTSITQGEGHLIITLKGALNPFNGWLSGSSLLTEDRADVLTDDRDAFRLLEF
jgi:hypothetical protein